MSEVKGPNGLMKEKSASILGVRKHKTGPKKHNSRYDDSSSSRVKDFDVFKEDE